MDEKTYQKPVRLTQKLDRVLKFLPFDLLGLVIFFAFTNSIHWVAILVAFDAYVWEVAGRITIAIALLSLLASAFVPMAYCGNGCPTGAMLKLFEFGKNDAGWTRRDYLSLGMLGLLISLYFFV